MRGEFSGTRLKLGRALRGLFIQEVAARAGVSPRSVGAWESGTTTPALAHIATLAEVLGVPQEFLCGCEPPALPPVILRGAGRLTARQRGMTLAAGVQAVILDGWFAERSERARPSLPEVGACSPADAASALREAWALGEGPVPPLGALLDDAGVRIYSLGYDGVTVDACAFRFDGIPFILVNSRLAPVDRRLCLAQQLGHLVLAPAVGANGNGSKAREDDADAFADAFLMPAGPFIESVPAALTLDAIEDARRAWNVSTGAYLTRLRDLGRLPDWRFRMLATEARMRGTAPAAIGDGGASPFLERCLAQDPDGDAARVAAAAHLRVYLTDLDALTFGSDATVGA